MYKDLADKMEEVEEIFNLSSNTLSNSGFKQKLDYYLSSFESQNGYIDANKEILDLKNELNKAIKENQKYRSFFNSSSWRRMSRLFSFLPKIRRFAREVKKYENNSKI